MGQLIVGYDSGSEWVAYSTAYDDESAALVQAALVVAHPWVLAVLLPAAEFMVKAGHPC